MSDENNSRYLSALEAQEVNRYADEYIEDPPEWHDPIMDPIDRSIMQSEGIPTLSTSQALAYQRRIEAEKTMQRGAPISEPLRQAIAADFVMADLDDALADHVRGNAPLAEDGGESYRVARWKEIETGQAEAERLRALAQKAAKQTAQRFAGTGFSREKTVTAEQFEKRRGR